MQDIPIKMAKNSEKVMKISKDLENLTGDENLNSIEPENEDGNPEDLDIIIEKTKRAFYRGNESASNNYRSPGEIIKEYISFDE